MMERLKHAFEVQFDCKTIDEVEPSINNSHRLIEASCRVEKYSINNMTPDKTEGIFTIYSDKQNQPLLGRASLFSYLDNSLANHRVFYYNFENEAWITRLQNHILLT